MEIWRHGFLIQIYERNTLFGYSIDFKNQDLAYYHNCVLTNIQAAQGSALHYAEVVASSQMRALREEILRIQVERAFRVPKKYLT